MKNNNIASPSGSYRKSLVRLLSTVGPVLAITIPGAAMAQSAVNTARVTVPSGTFEIDSSDNEVTDTDNVLAAIVANDDEATGINGLTGSTAVLNAFADDTVNGAPATTANATLAVAAGSSVPDGLTFNEATGDVSVDAGTAEGTYTFDYTICETANPANCQTATITVEVVAATIFADPDAVAGIDGAAGADDVLDVLDGDTLNSVQVTLADIDITVTTAATPVNPGDPVPTLDIATGLISVPAGTPAGVYSIVYEICETLNPANCASNTAEITVDGATIVANDDTVSGIDGITGATGVVNAFADDTVNGAPATATNATLAVAAGSSVPDGLTFNEATGDVSVDAGTPAGSYSFDYTICEILNPGNCQTATITVEVDAATISADPDSVSGVNGADGADDILDVLDGDTLGGNQVLLSEVDITITTPATPASPGDPVPTLDAITGQISVPAGTPAGTYTITYQICEKLNPLNCADNDVTITVNPSVDLVITKSNGVNEVTSGDTVTYDLVVTNNGPDSATGAVITDTPGAGLTCPAGNAVTFSGSGIPAGSFTISNLTGAGITLGTLANGQSITVTYSCQID